MRHFHDPELFNCLKGNGISLFQYMQMYSSSCCHSPDFQALLSRWPSVQSLGHVPCQKYSFNTVKSQSNHPVSWNSVLSTAWARKPKREQHIHLSNKRDCSLKNYNSVLASCCSKPVWVYFYCWRQNNIFWMDSWQHPLTSMVFFFHTRKVNGFQQLANTILCSSEITLVTYSLFKL